MWSIKRDEEDSSSDSEAILINNTKEPSTDDGEVDTGTALDDNPDEIAGLDYI